MLQRIKRKFLASSENGRDNLETPNDYEFREKMPERMRSDLKGRVCDVFFANKGERIDKWVHYLPIYEQLFARYFDSNTKMLEIGVFKGGSLGMWRKLFGPGATIFGIDINPDCAVFDGRSASVRIGSQDDPAFLKRVVQEMGGLDIVLDDGSHIGRQQQSSFETLFPLLNEGGLYVIEDLHTSYWPNWEGGLKRPGTIIEFLKHKIDEMHKHYQMKALAKVSPALPIESIQFFDSIAAIKKRAQSRRYCVVIPE